MPTGRQYFKRTLITALALIGGACIFVIATSKSEADRNTPRFVAGAPKVAVTNLAVNPTFDQQVDVPFQSGRMWVWLRSSRTNFHTYWINLDDRKVVGELFNASAEFSNQDQTKLFCSGRDSLVPVLKQRFAKWAEQLSGGRWKVPVDRNEAYWILDLRSNRARAIGSFSQHPGLGSSWHSSPGFRFGYNIPSTTKDGEEFYLCDLEREQMSLVRLAGDIRGWWDEDRLLVKDPNNNFVLYDVITQRSAPLFTAEYLHQFLKESNLPDDPGKLTATSTWNGDGYTFYFSNRRTWNHGQAFVLKLKPNAAAPALEVFQRDFHFEWLGKFNASGTLYVFPGERGESGRGGDGSVHIRDVQTGKEQTLIPSDQSNQYTSPRFYKNRVIYTKSRQFWSIEVNGSNNFKLFALPREADAGIP